MTNSEAGPTSGGQMAASGTRSATIARATKETDVKLTLALDGSGAGTRATGVGFLDHMLDLLARHGRLDLDVAVTGDLETGGHHTVEDTGIVLGDAFRLALGDAKGIARAGSFAFPMEEALAIVAVDIAGRPQLVWDVRFASEKVGDLTVGLLSEFFHGFARGLKANVHVKMPYGENDHHKAEAIFKAFAKALKQAVAVEGRAAGSVPSTKGSFD